MVAETYDACRRAGVLILLSGCSVLGVPLSAAAQDSAEASNGLQEVVVTAQKREENLQTVPLSVTAIGGETMRALHVQDLASVTGTVPNVQIQVNAGLTNAASF